MNAHAIKIKIKYYEFSVDLEIIEKVEKYKLYGR